MLGFEFVKKIFFFHNIGIMLAYFLTGQLGLLMAIPPGYATAIWPPSGIALAGVLLWGYRVWPGILLGSFLINVQISFHSTGLPNTLVAFVLPLIIASAAAFQCDFRGFFGSTICRIS